MSTKLPKTAIRNKITKNIFQCVRLYRVNDCYSLTYTQTHILDVHVLNVKGLKYHMIA